MLAVNMPGVFRDQKILREKILTSTGSDMGYKWSPFIVQRDRDRTPNVTNVQIKMGV